MNDASSSSSDSESPIIDPKDIEKLELLKRRPTIMKRSNVAGYEPSPKSVKISGKQISLQTVTSAGTPITTFDGQVYGIQQSAGNVIGSANTKQQIIRTADGKEIRIKPGTTIKIEQLSAQSGTPIRPMYVLKNPPAPKKTIRTFMVEAIEKSPLSHIGLSEDRLPAFKNAITKVANIPLIDLYITLKKLRTNEDFSLLGDYFELSKIETMKVFAKTVVRLAKYMKFLIQWPISKKYYDRHKNLPIAYRSKVSYVQSLIECVETEIQKPIKSSVDILNCTNYKFILTISPRGIITYVSAAFVGHNDDIAVFNASNFKASIPNYLSLVASPGKAIRRTTIKSGDADEDAKHNGDSDSTTDSAEESEDEENSESSLQKSQFFGINNGYGGGATAGPISGNHLSLNVVNSELKSNKVKNFSIPTIRVKEEICRNEIRQEISRLREYKILQTHTPIEPFIYQYINEILIIVSGLTNLER